MNVYGHGKQRQQGSAIALVLASIIVVIVVATGVLVAVRSNKNQPVAQGDGSGSKQTNSGDTTTNSDKVGPPTETPGRNARNTERANDASRLLAATAEYISNNSGQMPANYQNEQLGGGEGSTSSKASLNSYTSIEVAEGNHAAVTKNEMVLVIGASCGADGKAVAAGAREVVVLYGYENGDGDFSGKCVAM